MTTSKTKLRANWIFQASPMKYRILESLSAEKEEFWNLNQHSKHVHVDDRVFIWISGATAGIYAVGTVVAEPEMRPDSSVGIQYWYDPSNGLRVKARVRVRYDKVLVDRPLLKVYLECDPALWNLRILKNPRGTNFAVDESEGKALDWWLDQI